MLIEYATNSVQFMHLNLQQDLIPALLDFREENADHAAPCMYLQDDRAAQEVRDQTQVTNLFLSIHTIGAMNVPNLLVSILSFLHLLILSPCINLPRIFVSLGLTWPLCDTIKHHSFTWICPSVTSDFSSYHSILRSSQ